VTSPYIITQHRKRAQPYAACPEGVDQIAACPEGVDQKRHEYTLLVRLVSGTPIRRHTGDQPVPVTPRACTRSRPPTTSSSTFCIVPSWLRIGASAPNSGFINCHHSRTLSPIGDLAKLYGAVAVTTIPVPRIHYLARRIHLLGERPLAELFIELAAGRGLHGVLERYARLAPAADFIRAFGGDRLAGPRAVDGERR
jgi:hypothetical protein